ncbi:unnamed protein product [Rotaria sp. Silwood1]|nr:unnamed protein product [Rotaria sp. Silwood1]
MNLFLELFSYCKLLEYDFELGRLLWDLGSRARYFFDKLTEAFKQVALELSDYSLPEDIKTKIKIIKFGSNRSDLVRYEIPNCQDRGHFICFHGTVIRVGTPYVFDATRSYQCEECGSIVAVTKSSNMEKIKLKPTRCSNEDCTSVQFKSLKETDDKTINLSDYREIKVQESLQRVTSNNLPRSFSVILEDDLVEACKPGDDVAIYGFVQDRWHPVQVGGRGQTSLCLEANNVVVLNDQTASVSPHAYDEFEQYWHDNHRTPISARNRILASICPQLYGLYVVKLAIALILAGGVTISDEQRGIRVRSQPHLLLVGDPGTGKSFFLKYVAKMMPRAVLTTGVGSTSAGLTATAVRDGPGWTLEAGALVLADEGICCIDEFNTMKNQDKACILEAMEQQKISLAKGGMLRTLQTRCSIIASANPKGVYDNEDPLTINTALSSPLLSRFDLILLTLDSPNQEWDNIAATYITEGIDLLGHGTLKKPWPITKMRDYFMIIKSAEPEMTPEAETIIKTYYAMSRRITENTDRHITVRQLESTVRLAQAHAKLTFSKQVNILDAIVAVLLMETSLNGCGKLLDKINALHTTFAEQPEQEYEGHVHLVLDWLNLPNLRDFELERIKHEYDQSTAWTENDEYEKRTMPREFKKPLPPPPPPTLLPTSTTSTTTLLLTQIAQREKQKEGTSHQRTEHYSTPLTTKPPVFNNKLSPIDKIGPLTRVNTQILVPIQENDSFDDQSQVKRRKIDDQTLELNAIKEDTTEEKLLKSQNGKKKQKTSTDLINSHKNKKIKKQKDIIDENEEILSDTDIEEDDEQNQQKVNGNVQLDNLLLNVEHDDDDENNVHEQRLKRAKEYIEQIAKQEQEREADRDIVSERLRDDVLEQAGKLHRQVASSYSEPVLLHTCRGHQQSVTCVCISNDNKYAFTGSKDCSIIKWCLSTGKKLHLIRRIAKIDDTNERTPIIGHFDHVLAITISTNGQFLVSGDKANFIQVWNAQTCQHLKTLRGHQGPITGLTFRRNSHQLFSVSQDRSVKIWNLDEMSYVETLFGHQESIQAVDALMRERCVTAGGRDGSLRLWKIVEESHLVFTGHKGSIDCVALINDEHMVSGADDGSIALWSVSKRRPLFNLPHAHKLTSTDPSLIPSSLPEDFWITSLASLRYTDLLASGSFNGNIHLWKSTPEFNHLTHLFTLAQLGFVNDLKFSSDGNYLVVAIGQEHRLGRWWTVKSAKNVLLIYKLEKNK